MKRLVLCCALILGACAAEPPAAPPRDPNLVEVTFYRPHADAHASDYPFIYAEKDKKGALTDNAVVTVDLMAGTHTLTLMNPSLWEAEQHWTFNAVAGRKYWFRLKVGEAERPEGALPRYVSRFARVDEMPEAAAKAEIAAMQAPAEAK